MTDFPPDGTRKTAEFRSVDVVQPVACTAHDSLVALGAFSGCIAYFLTDVVYEEPDVYDEIGPRQGIDAAALRGHQVLLGSGPLVVLNARASQGAGPGRVPSLVGQLPARGASAVVSVGRPRRPTWRPGSAKCSSPGTPPGSRSARPCAPAASTCSRSATRSGWRT